jgi:hypothetical protein
MNAIFSYLGQTPARTTRQVGNHRTRWRQRRAGRAGAHALVGDEPVPDVEMTKSLPTRCSRHVLTVFSSILVLFNGSAIAESVLPAARTLVGWSGGTMHLLSVHNIGWARAPETCLVCHLGHPGVNP